VSSVSEAFSCLTENVVYYSRTGKPNIREQKASNDDLKIFVCFLTSAVEVAFFVEIIGK